MLFCIVVVLVVGFRFLNQIGFHFFHFRSGIGLWSVYGKICLSYSLMSVGLVIIYT